MRLSPDDVAAIRLLAAEVAAKDGAPPLSDEALIRLTHPDVVHLRVPEHGDVAGYAQLADGAAEILATDPATAATLLDHVAEHEPDLSVWAHGGRSPLIAAAESRGFVKVRTLWQLRRPLSHLPEAEIPHGIDVRPFAVGQDEQAWLVVNAAAFASHPEQGRWTMADLVEREAESWFDPAGFLLAWRGDELLGYHWTKVHREEEPALGEVYVLGVGPAAQGLRLGAGLLIAGLRHLAAQGLPTVLLYVDDDNVAAMRLYEKYGFTRHELDVQYRRSA